MLLILEKNKIIRTYQYVSIILLIILVIIYFAFKFIDNKVGVIFREKCLKKFDMLKKKICNKNFLKSHISEMKNP